MREIELRGASTLARRPRVAAALPSSADAPNTFGRASASRVCVCRMCACVLQRGVGDFRFYQGVWRLQPLPGCAPPGASAMRLTYSVELSPRAWVPVALLEGRIAAALGENLEAVRDYVVARDGEPEL